MRDFEFDEWASLNACDILCFCRMTTGNEFEGDELYQDTMLTLLEQREKLDEKRNLKSYALSVSIFLWKNKRRKLAWRKRLAPSESYEVQMENGTLLLSAEERELEPEGAVLKDEEVRDVRRAVCGLAEKYRTVLYLYYSADMKLREIADCLHIPESTVKSRMRKAKKLLKIKLEGMGYDG